MISSYKLKWLVIALICVLLSSFVLAVAPYPLSNPFNVSRYFDLNDDCDEVLGNQDCTNVNLTFDTRTPITDGGKSLYSDGSVGNRIQTHYNNITMNESYALCMFVNLSSSDLSDDDKYFESLGSNTRWMASYQSSSIGYVYTVKGGGSATLFGSSPQNFTNETWNLGCWLHSPGNESDSLSFYVNGVLQGSTVNANEGVDGSSLENIMDIFSNQGGTTQNVQGLVDQILIWNSTVPTVTQMQNIFTGDYPGALYMEIVDINGLGFTNGTTYDILSVNNFTVNITNADNFLWNITYNNGSVIFENNTNVTGNVSYLLFTEDGVYNITIFGNNTDGSEVITGWFYMNDTTFPTITWVNPGDDNNTNHIVNANFQLEMTLSDDNLFAYEIDVYNPSGDKSFNYSDTALEVAEVNIFEVFVPNVTGVWVVNASVSDDHTRKSIGNYNVSYGDSSLTFMFRDEKYEYYETEEENQTIQHKHLVDFDNNVSITYQGQYDIRSMNTIKKDDRYEFNYSFYLLEDKGKDEVKHKFRVECNGIYPRENSGYTAHFVCWDTKTWIDFENPDISKLKIKGCGKDCFTVEFRLPGNEEVTFSSIGGLNIYNQSVEFTVGTTLPTNTTMGVNQCPDSIAGQMSLWTLMFILLFFIIISLIFKLGVVGMFSTIGLMVLSWTLAGCQALIGYSVAGVGLVLFMFYAFQNWY